MTKLLRNRVADRAKLLSQLRTLTVMSAQAEFNEIKLSYSNLMAQARALNIAPADAAILMCHRLKISRAALIAYAERPVTATLAAQIQADFAARTRGVPVAYLCGVQEFYGLTLAVSPAVLIPRADTETLVDTALTTFDRIEAVHALDLGTGSGAIALALKSQRPHWQITAVDRSEAALAIARKNAETLKLEVKFLAGDWFAPVTGAYQLILANPPYVAQGDPHLNQGDLRFEPSGALAADDQGMADLRHIVDNAAGFLQLNGWLMLEHGYSQGPAVNAHLAQAGYENINIIKDLGGNDRVSVGQWLGRLEHS